MEKRMVLHPLKNSGYGVDMWRQCLRGIEGKASYVWKFGKRLCNVLRNQKEATLKKYAVLKSYKKESAGSVLCFFQKVFKALFEQ